MVGTAAENGAGGSSATASDHPPMNEDGHVSISRRGLIAAGLAVAAVGAIGITSTMNAGAAETPTTADEVVDPTEVPPALLPNGEKPRPIKLGRPGASSTALAAAGASAAADSPGPRTTAFGPKGQSRRSGVLRHSNTVVPPPLPPTGKASPTDDAYYFYAVGKQSAVTDGVSALFTVATPKVGPNDWHSLAEIAVQSEDEQQIVEVGWTVDRKTFGDDQTHLFVYHWVDGKESCYNCDFVPYSKAEAKVGMVLAKDPSKLFGIERNNGAWWIAYDTEWIGSFPDKLWNGSFTQSGLVQVFGEVASTTTTPCSQMGNGKTPDDSEAAKLSSVTYENGPPVKLKVGSTTDQYLTAVRTDRTFRYGGPPSKDC